MTTIIISTTDIGLAKIYEEVINTLELVSHPNHENVWTDLDIEEARVLCQSIPLITGSSKNIKPFAIARKVTLDITIKAINASGELVPFTIQIPSSSPYIENGLRMSCSGIIFPTGIPKDIEIPVDNISNSSIKLDRKANLFTVSLLDGGIISHVTLIHTDVSKVDELEKIRVSGNKERELEQGLEQKIDLNVVPVNIDQCSADENHLANSILVMENAKYLDEPDAKLVDIPAKLDEVSTSNIVQTTLLRKISTKPVEFRVKKKKYTPKN